MPAVTVVSDSDSAGRHTGSHVKYPSHWQAPAGWVVLLWRDRPLMSRDQKMLANVRLSRPGWRRGPLFYGLRAPGGATYNLPFFVITEMNSVQFVFFEQWSNSHWEQNPLYASIHRSNLERCSRGSKIPGKVPNRNEQVGHWRCIEFWLVFWVRNVLSIGT